MLKPNGFLSEKALAEKGFASLGENVDIDPSVAIVAPGRIHIGSNVRIDSFCLLSGAGGEIRIGDHVHIGAATHLFGGAGIRIEDFAGVSSRVSIFSKSDDYSEGYMTNPTVPERFKKVHEGEVVLERHALIGCGTVILPGVTIARGGSVGALSLVNRSVPEFAIVQGSPLRKVGDRDGEKLLELEREFLAEKESNAVAS
jgi:dTDP-4-amino-4,6-dideoxy-D-glucose acyltransferase